MKYLYHLYPVDRKIHSALKPQKLTYSLTSLIIYIILRHSIYIFIFIVVNCNFLVATYTNVYEYAYFLVSVKLSFDLCYFSLNSTYLILC